MRDKNEKQTFINELFAQKIIYLQEELRMKDLEKKYLLNGDYDEDEDEDDEDEDDEDYDEDEDEEEN